MFSFFIFGQWQSRKVQRSSSLQAEAVRIGQRKVQNLPLAPLAQLADAPDSKSEFCGFESHVEYFGFLDHRKDRQAVNLERRVQLSQKPFCALGGIGIHATLRMLSARMRVQVPWGTFEVLKIGGYEMNAQDCYNLLVDRYNRLAANPKNWKCPGVVRKLRRQIRKFNL